MEYVHNLIWLCPMLFVAGFIDSIAGGGGLIAMPAYMMCGMPMYYVYGCNKFQCAFGSTAAAYKYFKSGCLDLKITAVSAVSSFLCSFLGTRIIFYLTDAQIRSMLMVLLPLTAVLVIFVKNAWSYTAKEQSLTARNILMALITGMTIGLYDSLYGPGGGTIAMLLFTFLFHYDIRTSSGNAKMVLIVSNYTALISYILSGNVPFAIGIPCAVCNVLGNYIGRLCREKRSKDHPACDDLRGGGADRKAAAGQIRQQPLFLYSISRNLSAIFTNMADPIQSTSSSTLNLGL